MYGVVHGMGSDLRVLECMKKMLELLLRDMMIAWRIAESVALSLVVAGLTAVGREALESPCYCCVLIYTWLYGVVEVGEGRSVSGDGIIRSFSVFVTERQRQLLQPHIHNNTTLTNSSTSTLHQLLPLRIFSHRLITTDLTAT